MAAEFPPGLSQKTASERLLAEGANELGADQKRGLFRIAAEVVREPMFLLLLSAGSIYLVIGDVREALALLSFVVIIMVVTILQERRTENALEALRDFSSPRALVIRDGVSQRIAGRELVREDIVILTEGDRVPADGLLLQAHELAIDESMLTGESEAVAKFIDGGKAFAGTLVVRGQGLMQVFAIGAQTELGRIGKSLQTIALESSPLRDEINRLTRRLAIIAIGLCLVVSLLYWFVRGDALNGLLAGITLAMSILPQEFPVIMIIFLALGARRIALKKVLTRRLNAIETLGETTVLCVDKTGTLTENRMTLAMLCVDGKMLPTADIPTNALPENYHELLEYVVLASETEPHDPMELAFHRFAKEFLANTEHLHPDWSLAREYEISPALLAMSHLWRNASNQQDIVATKGAPEAIADLCHLDSAQCQALFQAAEAMADKGLRVLGVAKAAHCVGEEWPGIQHDFNFELVGLVGLADPLRAEVPAAVAECQRAGIRVVMITGDHPRTARAIAAQAGIQCETVLTGDDLKSSDPASLAAQIKSVSVFARVTPQQKLAIVEALKLNGEVVAMTGDGVNDAPALKAAHIGIAMGKRGTDVAREAASLVLLEDDFTAIVGSIRMGRRIFSNLRQALMYTVAVHLPIIGLSVLPLLFGLPLVLAPIHIAFFELVIDPACSIVFEAEEGSQLLMQQPPRAPKEHLVAASHFVLSLLLGTLLTIVAACYYGWVLHSGIATETARALTFVVLVTANGALILPLRSVTSNWRELFFGISKVGKIVLAGTLFGLIIVTCVPFIAKAFAFVPPNLTQWLAAFFIGIGMLFLFQLVKLSWLKYGSKE